MNSYEYAWKACATNLALFADTFESRYTAEVQAAYFAAFPRRRTFDIARVPPEIGNPIWDKWHAKAEAWCAAMMARRVRLTKLLNIMAKSLVMVPQAEMRQLYTTGSYNYRSQGWGAEKYAEGDAALTANLLHSGGFTVEVRRSDDGDRLVELEVWANATEWQLDALRRRRTYDEMREAYKKVERDHHVNARVYNPYLPYED